MPGVRPGQLVITGARPGMGKTAFTLALALRAVTRSGKRVLFFSLEMSVEELSERAVAALAKVDLPRLQSGELDQAELRRVDRAIAELHHADASRADRAMTSMIAPHVAPTMGARGQARRSISGLRLAPG